VARRLYQAGLALTPIVLVMRYAFDASDTLLFLVACGALAPLAYLIGEATENIAEHTGPGIGGFLNASFGNAPELIIALFAIHHGLPDVVRGSITGSVVSTGMLVLGAAIASGPDGALLDLRSLRVQISIVFVAVALFLIPAIPSWHGNPERHSLYLLSLPVAAVLLVLYLVVTTRNLRAHTAAHTKDASDEAWSLKRSLLALGLATIATALVSEVLVNTLESFGHQLGLSEFFVAVVIVALVGNAAEHGGAVVTARRGNTGLGAEIGVSSATQVAVFVAPIIALLSGLVGRGLPLSFRPIEIATMAGAAIVVAFVTLDARAHRWEGWLLMVGYAGAVGGFWVAGDR
jgi:Ca2+:H+ antiporter